MNAHDNLIRKQTLSEVLKDVDNLLNTRVKDNFSPIPNTTLGIGHEARSLLEKLKGKLEQKLREMG